MQNQRLQRTADSPPRPLSRAVGLSVNMKRYFILLSILFIAVNPLRAAVAQNSIVGEWIAVERTKGGLGASKSFNIEGIVVTTFGALVDFKYRISGTKMTLSYPNETDVVQKYQIKNGKLILINETCKQELSRLSGEAKTEIVGKWIGDHYTGGKQILHFTKGGNCYFSVPMVSEEGSYKIDGDRLTETYDKGKIQSWNWSIQSDNLTLIDLVNGKHEKYMRKK
jgi:hypothetical protein